jgi:hypothetical protein
MPQHVNSSRALFDVLRALELPASHFAIFGSGPLVIRHIIPASNDLDVICRDDAWRRVTSMGEIRYLEQYDLSVVSIMNGRITFGNEWGIGDFDVNLLIDTAETISGLPFVRLEHVIAYKRIANRPKDIRHIDAAKRLGFLQRGWQGAIPRSEKQ